MNQVECMHLWAGGHTTHPARLVHQPPVEDLLVFKVLVRWRFPFFSCLKNLVAVAHVRHRKRVLLVKHVTCMTAPIPSDVSKQARRVALTTEHPSKSKTSHHAACNGVKHWPEGMNESGICLYPDIAALDAFITHRLRTASPPSPAASCGTR